MAMQPHATDNLKCSHDALIGTAGVSPAASWKREQQRPRLSLLRVMSRLTSLGARQTPAVPVKRGQSLASVRSFCLIAFLIAASTWPTTAQTPQTNLQPETGSAAIQVRTLSSESAQIAHQIGVAPLLDQLGRQRAGGSLTSL